MEAQTCPNCNKPIQLGDEVCRYCGFAFPFSTSILPPESILHNRYEIQELVHTGGMGFVYLAKDKTLFDRLCVVKQVRDQLQSKEHQEKLEEEALRMAKLNHPNVAMILDHFVESSYYFLVEEYIRGKTLSEVFEERDSPLQETGVLQWAKTICDVLIYLHSKGIIHRDISPDNIILTSDGSIKFIDFGTLRELREVTTGGTAGMGKFGFSPPEQWQGRPEPRSDIFALGATLYFLLTGFLPLSREYQAGQGSQRADFYPDFPPIRGKNSGISAQFERILQKALYLDIDNRYASASDMWHELDELLTQQHERKSKASNIKSKPFRSRTYAIVASIFIVLGFVGTGIYYLALDNGPTSVTSSTVVPGPIQNAINTANDGDVIFIGAGTYNENVIVDKSVSLKGEDAITTIVTSLDGNTVFTVTANDVSISGLTIKGATGVWQSGILVSGANNVNISNNIVERNANGIEVLHSNGTSIVNNVVRYQDASGAGDWDKEPRKDNGHGIKVANAVGDSPKTFIGDSLNTLIVGNDIYYNFNNGIHVGWGDHPMSADGTKINGNKLYRNGDYSRDANWSALAFQNAAGTITVTSNYIFPNERPQGLYYWVLNCPGLVLGDTLSYEGVPVPPAP